MPNMPDRWSKDLEHPLYEAWRKKHLYRFNRHSNKPIYSIDTPPPYVNTPAHIGQATTYVLMDMFARFKRMTGHEVIFPLGLDRNGLPIEMAAEKTFKVKMHDVSREAFLKLCESILEESSSGTSDSFLKCGIGFNSYDFGTEIGEAYMTDSEDYRRMTQDTFIDLWHKGLIYEGTYLTNYCPGCRTTLADAEVVREQKNTLLNYVKFKIAGKNEFVTIATTRPELLCTSAMVIYHPDDERYQHLKEKKLITPIFNTKVPVAAHPAADPHFGTGVVFMSASAGDQDAIRFLREMNIEPVACLGLDGKMTEKGAILEGLTTREARKKILSLLKEQDLLEKQEQLIHHTPVCERSGDEIEFVSLPEYYLKQVDMKKDLLKLQEQIRFYDERSRQILVSWIESISIDGPLSRSRYYGTEIPLWHCKKCKATIVPEKGKYRRPWKEPCPVKTCACGGTDFEGETKIFDTWFDSSSSAFYIMGYIHDPAFFKKHFPALLRPQGKEIVRTWLYYTLLKSYLLLGKPAFRDVWINYHIVDERGHKMSKSKGNIIDPQEVLKRYGAEPFRLWAAIEGNLTTTDFRCSFDRIEGAGKTLTKLWNVGRFISQFPSVKKPRTLEALDRWILQELHRLIDLTREGYGKYDFHNPVVALKHFLWEPFASHYLEMVKSRAYNKDKIFTKNQQDSALYTLHYCLDALLKLLAPVLPFITATLYHHTIQKDIHFEPFPEAMQVEPVPFTTLELIELNGAFWKAKKDSNLSLKDKIARAMVDAKFKDLQQDLLAAHHIKTLAYGKTFSASF